MNTRLFRLYSLAAACCALLAQQPQQPLISIDRSFKSSPVPNPPDDWEVQFERTDWAREFLAINPARSLLLSDCSPKSPWCGLKDFGFESIFAQAATVANLTADDAAKAWYTYATTGPIPLFADRVAPWKGKALTGAPFQPLAIVNRMDLAHYGEIQKKWIGAEVRFVYGVVPPPLQPGQNLPGSAKFTLILEFTIPPRSWDEFRNLALNWMAVTTAPDNYLPLLKATIRECHLEDSPLVRLRMNREFAGDRWALSQWEFGPNGFTPEPLTDQIDVRFRTAKPNTDDYNRYLKLWAALNPVQLDAGSIAIDPYLRAPNEILYGRGSLETPMGQCNVDESARNILAMQQCAFCHTNEAAVQDFNHISNRKPGESSVLSEFLSGKNPRPSILQLWYATNDAFSNQSVPYTTSVGSGGGPCNTQATKTANRSFNDLARRALFLAGVLAFPDENHDDAYLIQLARTNFAH